MSCKVCQIYSVFTHLLLHHVLVLLYFMHSFYVSAPCAGLKVDKFTVDTEGKLNIYHTDYQRRDGNKNSFSFFSSSFFLGNVEV